MKGAKGDVFLRHFRPRSKLGHSVGSKDTQRNSPRSNFLLIEIRFSF